MGWLCLPRLLNSISWIFKIQFSVSVRRSGWAQMQNTIWRSFGKLNSSNPPWHLHSASLCCFIDMIQSILGSLQGIKICLSRMRKPRKKNSTPLHGSQKFGHGRSCWIQEATPPPSAPTLQAHTFSFWYYCNTNASFPYVFAKIRGRSIIFSTMPGDVVIPLSR